MKRREPPFTEKQIEVVRLLAIGDTKEEIAEKMGCGERTAKYYCDTLRRKLRVEFSRQVPLAYFQQTGDNPWPTRSLA